LTHLLLVNDADAFLHIGQNRWLVEKPVLSVRVEAVAASNHAGAGGLCILNEFLNLSRTTVNAARLTTEPQLKADIAKTGRAGSYASELHPIVDRSVLSVFVEPIVHHSLCLGSFILHSIDHRLVPANRTRGCEQYLSGMYDLVSSMEHLLGLVHEDTLDRNANLTSVEHRALEYLGCSILGINIG
jgi:hypothetical protein